MCSVQSFCLGRTKSSQQNGHCIRRCSELSQVVHPSCRSICHSSEPQTSTVCIASPRPKCLGHRCSELKLVGSHCLCLPSLSSPSQGDPENQAIQLPDHCNSPRLARDALVLVPSAALCRDPTSTTSVKNSSQTVPQLWVSQQSTTSQLQLNELTKAPFEPMKDTGLKHLTLKTAFLLALASSIPLRPLRPFTLGYQWTKSCKHVTGKLTTHLQIFT